eukprot:9516036-Alexandrium_andersonii.AAC.1
MAYCPTQHEVVTDVACLFCDVISDGQWACCRHLRAHIDPPRDIALTEHPLARDELRPWSQRRASARGRAQGSRATRAARGEGGAKASRHM